MNEFKYLVLPGNSSNIVSEKLSQWPYWNQYVWAIQTENYDKELMNPQEISFIWKPNNFCNKIYNDIKNLDDQKITVLNHIYKNQIITTKDQLIACLYEYYKGQMQASFIVINLEMNDYSVWDSTPLSFVLTPEFNNQDFKRFNKVFKDIKIKTKNIQYLQQKQCQENIWIVKPVNLNQVYFCLIREKEFKFLIIMSRLKILLVLNNLKLNGQFKNIQKNLCFTNKENLTLECGRISKNFYEFIFNIFVQLFKSRQKSEIHLTNNCLQRNLDNFGLYEEGNTLTFQEFQTYLDKNQINVNVQKDLMPRMKDLIIDSILAGKKYMVPNTYSFELLGYDFMIDEDYRIWLIEINHNPQLGMDNNKLKNSNIKIKSIFIQKLQVI